MSALFHAIATVNQYLWQNPNRQPWIKLAARLVSTGKVFFECFGFAVKQSFWEKFFPRHRVAPADRFEFCMRLYIRMCTCDKPYYIHFAKNTRFLLTRYGGGCIWREDSAPASPKNQALDIIPTLSSGHETRVFFAGDVISFFNKELIKCAAFCTIQDRIADKVYSLEGHLLQNEHDVEQTAPIHFKCGTNLGVENETKSHSCFATVASEKQSGVSIDLDVSLGCVGNYLWNMQGPGTRILLESAGCYIRATPKPDESDWSRYQRFLSSFET